MQYNDVTFERFEEAIRALYGHEGPEQQRLANEYLIHVWNNCKQSWEYGLRILVRPVQAEHGDPTHTQYFCANMIYGKIRQEWFLLAQSEQQAIQGQLEYILAQIRNGQLVFAPLVLKRICMAMTVLYLAMDGGCARCVNECVSSVSSVLQVQVALELLTSLCDENDDSYLPPSRKDALVIEITDASAKVFPFITKVFDTSFGPETESMRIGGLACLKAWIKAAGFSLAKLYTNMPSVFHALLQAFQQPQNAPGALKEVVLCALILSDALEVNEYPPASSKEEAMALLASTLLSSQATIAHYLQHDSNVAHAVTTLVSTFGESELDWFVHGSQEALNLTELLMVLVSQPNRQIASLTFDFWLGLQDYPVASRHAAFQGPIFQRILHLLVYQCAIRDGDDGEDEEDVKSFRLSVAEVLLAIYHLLKSNFLVDVGRELEAASSSPAIVEAAMFVLTTIAPELKQKILDDPPTQQLVLAICRNYIFVHPAFTTIPSVVKAASVFLGFFGSFANATWATAQDDSLLQASLQYLSFALSIPEASTSASKSINLLCASCATLLTRKDSLISSLLQSLNANIGHLTMEDRDYLLEGIVRVACLAPWGQEALKHLLTPLFQRMDTTNIAELPRELSSLSTVLRFMDAPSAEAGGPALTQQVISSSWPHLSRVASAASMDVAVHEALFDVFSSILKAKKQENAVFVGTPEFEAIVQWILLHVVNCPAALQCAIVVIEFYGGTSPQVDRMIAQIGQRVLAHCQSVASPGQIPDLLRAYFELSQRCVIFCPSSLLEDRSAYFASMQLAIVCLQSLDHREALRAVIVFLNHLVTKRETTLLLPFQSVVDAGIDQHKGPLWMSLIQLLTNTCPSTVLASVISLVFHILTNYGQSMHGPLQVALESIDSVVSMEERGKLYTCWINMATNYQERKFSALAKDYAKVCRKEMPCEHLTDHFVI